MLKQIFRKTSLLIASSILICLILFSKASTSNALVKGWSTPEDESSSLESNGNNPLKIVIVPSEENQKTIDEKPTQKSDKSTYPDLGSDQVFPFVAGLGAS